LNKPVLSVAIGLVASVCLVYVYDYLNITYVYGEGLEQIARAESAQTPSELISHVIAAKNSLPEGGSAAWWASDETNFRQIQQELNLVLGRAEAISLLTSQNERYNSEMLDMHANLRVIQEKILIGCLAC
jgi:hypothetical protein